MTRRQLEYEARQIRAAMEEQLGTCQDMEKRAQVRGSRPREEGPGPGRRAQGGGAWVGRGGWVQRIERKRKIMEDEEDEKNGPKT